MQPHHASPFPTVIRPSYRLYVIEHDTNSGRGARLYQAQRMVSEQAGCSISEAFSALQNTADATDESVEVIAAMVLNRAVRFDGFA